MSETWSWFAWQAVEKGDSSLLPLSYLSQRERR
jgi:hypothetical protein